MFSLRRRFMYSAAQEVVATRFLGLSRSGNHAIIDWVLRQLPTPWTFLNCVEPEREPFTHARPLDDGRCRVDSRDSAGSLAHLLFSQEDCFLRTAWGKRASAVHERALKRHLDVSKIEWRDILILRNPYNFSPAAGASVILSCRSRLRGESGSSTPRPSWAVVPASPIPLWQ
jgi:hypothetical protein